MKKIIFFLILLVGPVVLAQEVFQTGTQSVTITESHQFASANMTNARASALDLIGDSADDLIVVSGKVDVNLLTQESTNKLKIFVKTSNGYEDVDHNLPATHSGYLELFKVNATEVLIILGGKNEAGGVIGDVYKFNPFDRNSQNAIVATHHQTVTGLHESSSKININGYVRISGLQSDGQRSIVNLTYSSGSYSESIINNGNATNFTSIESCDYDLDGDYDIIRSGQSSFGLEFILEINNGNQNFTSQIIETGFGLSQATHILVDTDGDLDDDIIAVGNAGSGVGVSAQFINTFVNGVRTFERSPNIIQNENGQPLALTRASSAVLEVAGKKFWSVCGANSMGGSNYVYSIENGNVSYLNRFSDYYNLFDSFHLAVDLDGTGKNKVLIFGNHGTSGAPDTRVYQLSIESTLSVSTVDKEDKLFLYGAETGNLLFSGSNNFKKIEIFSMDGKKIKIFKNILTSTSFKLDISNLKKGMYILKGYTEENKIITKKFIR